MLLDNKKNKFKYLMVDKPPSPLKKWDSNEHIPKKSQQKDEMLHDIVWPP